MIELTYDFFIDLKTLQDKWGYNYNEDEDKKNVIWNHIKVLKFSKDEPFMFHYKISYNQTDWSVVNMRNKRKKMLKTEDISLTKAYSKRLELAQNKKKDLKDLLNKNLITFIMQTFIILYCNILVS